MYSQLGCPGLYQIQYFNATLQIQVSKSFVKVFVNEMFDFLKIGTFSPEKFNTFQIATLSKC